MAWHHHHSSGVLGFITRREHVHDDGRRAVVTSRRRRKGRGAWVPRPSGPLAPGHRSPWLRFWAPHRLGWWLWLIFMLGSLCFVYGSMGLVWPPGPGPTVINLSFFIGSLFFTVGCSLQLLEAINAPPAPLPGEPPAPVLWRWWAWRPRDIAWLLAAVQLVGALLFNMNTYDGTLSWSAWGRADEMVWTPGILGGLCFMVAGWLGVVEVCHRPVCLRPRALDWWIGLFNTLGALGFFLNGVFGFQWPQDWPDLSNWALFLGSLFFLAGTHLLLPEQFME